MEVPKLPKHACFKILIIGLALNYINGDAKTKSTKDICDSDKYPISTIINHLGSELAEKIGGRDNYFFSPLSISIALGMVYLGTRGTTRNQMTEALGYELLGDDCLSQAVSEGFSNLISSLENKNGDYTLLVANGIFIQDGYDVLRDYIKKLNDYFQSSVKTVDFANEGEITVDVLNKWVANHTNNHIVKLLNEPLDPMTVMVLTNAVYFKGLWLYEFREGATWNSDFHTIEDGTRSIPFMMIQHNFNYYNDKVTKYSYLEMDYKGNDISMLVALPDDSNDFPDLDLTPELLCNIRASLKPTQLTVIMPKFKLEYRRELSKDLMPMGMDELFSERADLTRIRPQNDLHVSLMLHKAIVEVNEKGSVASGISGVGIDSRKPSGFTTFWANHPFLFYILDKKTGTILFMGRMTDPEPKTSAIPDAKLDAPDIKPSAPPKLRYRPSHSRFSSRRRISSLFLK